MTKDEKNRMFFAGLGGTSPLLLAWTKAASDQTIKIPAVNDFFSIGFSALLCFGILFAVGAGIGLASMERNRWKLLMLGMSIPALLDPGVSVRETEKTKGDPQAVDGNALGASPASTTIGFLEAVVGVAHAAQNSGPTSATVKNFGVNLSEKVRLINISFYDEKGELIAARSVDQNLPMDSIRLPRPAASVYIHGNLANGSWLDLRGSSSKEARAMIEVSYRATPLNGLARGLGFSNAQPFKLIGSVTPIQSNEPYFEKFELPEAFGTAAELERFQSAGRVLFDAAENAKRTKAHFNPYSIDVGGAIIQSDLNRDLNLKVSSLEAQMKQLLVEAAQGVERVQDCELEVEQQKLDVRRLQKQVSEFERTAGSKDQK
jgi:hypothetical protein